MEQSDNYEKWHAAFLKLLDDSKHGVQNKLAEYCGRTSKYIGDIKLQRADIKTGRIAQAGPDLQSKIAEFFNMSLDAMITYGGTLINPGEEEAFPFYTEIMRLQKREQRALSIAQSAAMQLGLEKWLPKGLDFHLFPTQPGQCNQYIDDYLTGIINENELYQGLLNLFTTIEFDIKRRFRRERLISG